MATNLRPVAPSADPLDGMSLPGWLYHDAEFFAAESHAFLRAAPRGPSALCLGRIRK
jgi:hypothetical protein